MEKIVLYTEKSKCCGCGACKNVCPKQAITMQEDEYGFLYPHIDENLCIGCGACKRVCAYQNGHVDNQPIEAYAAVNCNREQKLQSASGGIFAAMATKVLADGGVVVGAALDVMGDEFVPHHVVVDTQENLYRLQGSKYVQSATEDTYKQVQALLQKGVTVLYSGTPCQIAGLQGFLRRDYDNLITIDLICHGVPNAKLFNDYLKLEKEKRKAQKLLGYSFRDKRKGWGMNGRLDYIKKNGEKVIKYIPARLVSYNTFFLDGLIYRENCYSCRYACENRPGDITIGDYWGIEKEHPELNDSNGYNEKEGISCIIINTSKGVDFCRQFHQLIRMEKSTFEKIAKKNHQLNEPSVCSPKREKILEMYKKDGYQAIDRLFYQKYKKQILVHHVYNAIPRKLRIRLKAVLKG